MPREMRLTRALVDKVPATISDPGPIAEIADVQTEDVLAETVQTALRSRPDPDQFWVFAFGSLMWKPDFEFAERRRARVLGWHRSFCLGPDTRYRGNPDRPAIMLSLDHGATCDGVIFRLDEATLPDCLAALIEREPPIPPVWVDTETDDGALKSLAFVRDAAGRGHVTGLSPKQIAAQIAGAVGIFGSMADYVHNTALHLEEMGIHDPTVWQMQDLVAAELEHLP